MHVRYKSLYIKMKPKALQARQVKIAPTQNKIRKFLILENKIQPCHEITLERPLIPRRESD